MKLWSLLFNAIFIIINDVSQACSPDGVLTTETCRDQNEESRVPAIS